MADILGASVRVMDKRICAFGLPIEQGLLQRVEHEIRSHRTAHPPAHDAPVRGCGRKMQGSYGGNRYV